MTLCDFSHLRIDVRELANMRKKKKTEPGYGILSRTEE